MSCGRAPHVGPSRFPDRSAPGRTSASRP
jgi:hypothetical protein